MKNNTKKSINIGKINIPLNYWTGLAVYAVILLILAICMIAYTGSCLKKYENSQSDKVMNDFLNDFTKMAADKTLADNIELPASSEFEGKDTFVNMYMSELDGTTDYTYKKSEGSYNTEEPMYDIYADDKKVARMTLEAKDQHVVLGILTVFDWKVKSIEPVFSAKTNDYTVSIPEGYTFTVNGITVSDDYKTGKVIDNPDFVNVSKYATMPKSVEYKLTGFVNKPEIKIYNASGSEVTANVDAKGNVSVAASGNSADMPSERKEEALNMAKIWDNFLTNDLSGSGHGLATVQQYLIEDSYYWNLAKDYASSADITFISDHTLSGNPYTGVTVDNYIEYNDDCYSCHIAFTKNMTLTSGGARKDVIDSTFYFVKYEAIAAMDRYLAACPSEGCIVQMQRQGDAGNDATFRSRMGDYLNSSSAYRDRFVDFRPDLTLGELRGKILVLTRSDYDGALVGGKIASWQDDVTDQISSIVNGSASAKLFIQDKYGGTTGIDNKKNAIIAYLDKARGKAESEWLFNFTSLATAVVTTPKTNARTLNPATCDYLKAHPGCTGVVMMDFAGDTDVSGDELLRAVIDQNFYCHLPCVR